MEFYLIIFPILSLLSAAVSFGIGIFVFAKNPKNTVHKMFFLTCVLASYWAFTEYMIRISGSPESAAMWMKIAAFWIFMPVTVLHFTLLFTGSAFLRKKRKYVTYAAMYIPPLIFTILELTTNMVVAGPQRMLWGYTYRIAEDPTLFIIESFWAVLMIMLSLIVCLRYYSRTAGRKRKQAGYMMLGLAFPFAAGLWLIAATPETPDLIIASILFYFYFVASAIWRYRLFEVTPESTAEEIIETMNDALIILDGDERIITVNDAAVRLLGYEKEALAGMTFSSILRNEEDMDEIYGKTIKFGSFSDHETLFARSGGEDVPVSCSCSEIRDPDGSFAGIVLIARDITRRKRDEYSIKQANDKLKLLNSITRHDMLNQLTALKGYLLLSQQTAEGNLEKYIGHCVNTADRISEQIEFTKDYQEIGIKSPEWMDAGDVIDGVAEKFGGEKPTISSSVRETEIYADPLFERVIYNLIDNSIRHGERVTKISFSGLETESGLDIICEDDGAGIPDHEKPDLFKRGFGKNTGLGLFLSSEILSITGITISENGESGTGARFVIHIPPGGYRITAG